MSQFPPLDLAIQHLQRLVAFDTTSRLSNLALIEHVEQVLRPLGARIIRVLNDAGTKANLLASFGPETGEGIVLSGHTDVVPVDGQSWTSDPFLLRREGTRLYGRGTADMKGFLAAMLAVAPMLGRGGLSRAVHLAFTYDEEVGCLGAPSLIRRLLDAGIEAGLVIVGEPTEMRLVNANKGILRLRTVVTGLEAHSSQPQLGLNAIEVAAELILFLKGLAGEMALRGDPSGRFTPPMTTINVGTIEGGTATNIIPRLCAFTWEYRPLPQTDEGEIARRFAGHVEGTVLPALRARHPLADIRTEASHRVPGLAPEADGAAETLVKMLLRVNETHAVSYAAEAGLYQQADMPALLCGPGSIAEAHKADEFVEIGQLEACVAFLTRLAEHLRG